jgi:hypothetical protein
MILRTLYPQAEGSVSMMLSMSRMNRFYWFAALGYVLSVKGTAYGPQPMAGSSHFLIFTVA